MLRPAQIKALPLYSTPQLDELIWPFEKSGKYSVKSSFRLLCERQDSIENLLQASIDERGAHEDTLHSLWSCNGLKKVWEKDFGWIFRFGVVLSSFKELVKLVFTKSKLVPLFATTAWSVWFHRNKFRVSENARPLGQIVDFARDYVRDFKSLKSSTPTVRVTTPKVWSPPDCEVKAALAEKIMKPPIVEALELLVARRTALFSEKALGVIKLDKKTKTNVHRFLFVHAFNLYKQSNRRKQLKFRAWIYTVGTKNNIFVDKRKRRGPPDLHPNIHTLFSPVSLGCFLKFDPKKKGK
nr:hypothetical protein CFP56_33348 [Quercus suber]